MESDNFLIFQPAKSAMQSGIGKSKKWCLSNSVANKHSLIVFLLDWKFKLEQNLTLFLIR